MKSSRPSRWARVTAAAQVVAVSWAFRLFAFIRFAFLGSCRFEFAVSRMPPFRKYTTQPSIPVNFIYLIPCRRSLNKVDFSHRAGCSPRAFAKPACFETRGFTPRQPKNAQRELSRPRARVFTRRRCDRRSMVFRREMAEAPREPTPALNLIDRCALKCRGSHSRARREILCWGERKLMPLFAQRATVSWQKLARRGRGGTG